MTKRSYDALSDQNRLPVDIGAIAHPTVGGCDGGDPEQPHSGENSKHRRNFLALVVHISTSSFQY